MKMRSYGCTYYAKINGEFILNTNQACWAGIDKIMYWKINNYKLLPKVIYIADFQDYIKEDYINKMIYIINKITPCRIINYKNKKYIAYRFIKDATWYNNNLVVLNWIRGLWHHQRGLKDVEEFYQDIMKYDDNEDPLYFLMSCNKKHYDGKSYGLDHSNFCKNIVPKNKSILFEAKATDNEIMKN